MKKYLIPLMTCLIIVFVHASFISNEPANKAELGKLLFFDPILSKDHTISCASCHKPASAFADTSAVSVGVRGAKGTRNTPSAMNLSLQRILFWDGRVKSLEEQALKPIENPKEMNLPIKEALERLKRNNNYSVSFKKLFGSEPTAATLAEALAAFERTLETSSSPFDEWKFSDNPNAVSDAVKKGFAIFSSKGKCTECHFGADFTINDFRNIGLFNGKDLNDSGRVVITGQAEHLGRFKVPGLRNIALTAPYMHNGMFKTIREVLDFYNDPDKIVPNSINRDSLIKPLGLTPQELNNLEAFLFSLTDKRFTSEEEKHFY
jgi:cytochrome c peroxidase